jgi:hypothetical protein
MRYPDRPTEGAAFLKEAIAAPRRNRPGRRVDRVLMEVLIRVERLIPLQEIQIAVIRVGAGDRIH